MDNKARKLAPGALVAARDTVTRALCGERDVMARERLLDALDIHFARADDATAIQGLNRLDAGLRPAREGL
ncbi:hypothetical protein [Azospirillum thermophilum]|uniref:Uncharacterized protein n=1 Tax=Azospirillum thermophilum TaxID=2202148 RepID=A0A2S2CRK0_9PROT|nr:hypothetical protein [Azospirillum thermophilum]AWK87089.1 hypothetical protein DEW08_13390 [Azospirillum thermophilum]